MESEKGKAAASEEAPKPVPRRDPVRTWTLVLLALALVLLVIHLRADRFTPYTAQARLNALVVPVAAQVSGSVISVSVSNNQAVASGDVLFRISPAQYELAVQAAEASLDAARQAVGASTASVDAARASLDAARAGLQRSRQDYERLQRIFAEDPGAISQRRLELSQASLLASEADLDAAQASVERAVQELGQEGEANSRVLQAQSALDQARIDLAYTTVTAPADGVVTDVRIDVGNFAAAGAPQMTFIGTRNFWVEAEFTENNLGHIDRGDPVEILFDAFPGRIFSGTVREIGFGVQVSGAPLGSLPTITNERVWLREAQRFPVLIDIEQVSGRDELRGLKVGSQASVIVYTGGHTVLRWLGQLYIRVASILTYAY